MSFFRPNQFVRLLNEARKNVLCERCAIANTAWTRGRGLLGRTGLDAEEGILLVPGNSIHMFGMKFAIDVIFLTREDVVTDLVENIAPGKAHVAKAGAGKPYAALEMAAGTVARTGVSVGDQLRRETL